MLPVMSRQMAMRKAGSAASCAFVLLLGMADLGAGADLMVVAAPVRVGSSDATMLEA
jgi:hypothetical protein